MEFRLRFVLVAFMAVIARAYIALVRLFFSAVCARIRGLHRKARRAAKRGRRGGGARIGGSGSAFMRAAARWRAWINAPASYLYTQTY